MKQNDPKNIHFLGIGGSGASAAAIIAKKSGFNVTGCNLQLNTPYIKKVKDYKIKIFEGHSKDHIERSDVLAVSPALFFSDEEIEELEYAKKNRRVVSWQRFVGEQLLPDKKVISVAGTHGKSTTTAMTGLMMEKSELDPTVLIGAKVPQWKANFKLGKSKYFLIESDEFYNNFLNYKPDYVILNNIEYDHPDFFKSEQDVFESFKKFINQMKGEKILIVNQDSKGVRELLKELNESTLKGLKLLGYTTKKSALMKFDFLYKASKIKSSNGKSSFVVKMPDDTQIKVNISLPGKYNISNSLGAIALLDQLDADMEKATTILGDYKGIGRRMELIAEQGDIKIYDDYAHHPTAIRATLEALREKYPKVKLLAVIEPHSYSRTKALLSDYKKAFVPADSVIIGPIFKARDEDDFGVSGKDIAEVANHKNIKYFDQQKKIIDSVKEVIDDKGVVIVMGAGDSYKWARNICEFL